MSPESLDKKRACNREYMRAKRSSNPEMAEKGRRYSREYAAKNKPAISAARTKRRLANLDQFLQRERAAHAKHRDRDRNYMRQRRAADPDGERRRAEKWFADNPGKLAAYRRAWREANPEKFRERWREWYAANVEEARKRKRELRKANLELAREKERKWARARHGKHPEKNRVQCAKRSALKRGALGHHSPSDVKSQYDRQCGKCYWCLSPVGKTYHVDHVVPLAKGGSNGPENIVIACPSCNVRKGAELPAEFAGRFL
jgi:5-methylcytosine-specific restriction endonuclease McrA